MIWPWYTPVMKTKWPTIHLIHKWKKMIPNITLCILEAQDNVTNTLNKVQYQSSIDRYLNDVKTSTGDSAEEFNSWHLSVEEVSALMHSDPKEICFGKAEVNLKFLYCMNLKKILMVYTKEQKRVKKTPQNDSSCFWHHERRSKRVKNY